MNNNIQSILTIPPSSTDCERGFSANMIGVRYYLVYADIRWLHIAYLCFLAQILNLLSLNPLLNFGGLIDLDAHEIELKGVSKGGHFWTVGQEH